MTHNDLEAITSAVRDAVERQAAAVAIWHDAEPEGLDEPAPAADLDALRRLAAAEHLTNYRLWHVEDEARRTDVNAEVIADCKRRIDALNQKRNDLIEKVDACIVGLVSPLIPQDARRRYNTETVGSALDRLSIMALKAYHMQEQTERDDVTDEHRASCLKKLDVLHEQRADLLQSVCELLADYAAGEKLPKVYYQFKMYNDPSLNPALYANKGKDAG